MEKGEHFLVVTLRMNALLSPYTLAKNYLLKRRSFSERHEETYFGIKVFGFR